ARGSGGSCDQRCGPQGRCAGAGEDGGPDRRVESASGDETAVLKHSPHLSQLIEALRALPGVGPKTAQRMAFHLLQEGRPGARVLASALDEALVCVVESPADVVAIEQSGSYRGRYFVLMGHLSPLDGIGPEQLGIRELEAL